MPILPTIGNGKRETEDRKVSEAKVGPYRVMLVGDHSSLRRNFEPILAEMGEVIEVGEGNNSLDLLTLLGKTLCHFILFAPSFANPDGFQMIRKVKALRPEVKIVVLAMTKDKETLHHALSAGAEGYLLAGDREVKISAAIDAIRRGRVYISPAFLEHLSGDWVETCRENWNPLHKLLTSREGEVLKLIAEGRSSKEIADLLFVSVRTVEHHRSNIMEKLNLRNTASLIKYAVCQGCLI